MDDTEKTGAFESLIKSVFSQFVITKSWINISWTSVLFLLSVVFISNHFKAARNENMQKAYKISQKDIDFPFRLQFCLT